MGDQRGSQEAALRPFEYDHTRHERVWLPFAFFWLGVGVFQVFQFRKTKQRAYLIGAALMFVAAGTFALMAFQQPQ